MRLMKCIKETRCRSSRRIRNILRNDFSPPEWAEVRIKMDLTRRNPLITISQRWCLRLAVYLNLQRLDPLRNRAWADVTYVTVHWRRRRGASARQPSAPLCETRHGYSYRRNHYTHTHIHEGERIPRFRAYSRAVSHSARINIWNGRKTWE